MKTKRLLMLTMSVLAVATLGSCRGRGGRGGSSATSGEQATSSTTGGHIIPTTGGTTGGNTGTSSSTATHTCKSVIIDICKILFEEDDPKSDLEDSNNYSYWDNGDGTYGTGVSFGSYDESYLESAVESVAEEIPTYLVSQGDPEADTWSDGSNGYFQLFLVDEVAVQVGSYVDSGTLGTQIDVFPSSQLSM